MWVRLDEDFASHPKVVEAGPLGIALQVAALCYCNRHLTDGRVPRGTARSLLDFEGIAMVNGMSGEDVEPNFVIGLLVDAGLWHEPGHDCPDCPDIERGYIIHDFLEQQPSREEVLARREQAAEAGRKGGRAKRNAKRPANRTASDPLSGSSSETEADRQAEVEAKSKPGPGPVPVPVPTDVGKTKPSPVGDRSPVDAQFAEFWDAYPRGKAGKPGGDGPRKPALQKWRRLTDDERAACLVAVHHYRDHIADPDAPHAAHATTWLNQARWEQWQEPAAPRAGPASIANVSKITEGGRF